MLMSEECCCQGLGFEVFCDLMLPTATAILDRFLHHAEILTFTGKSYRLRGNSNRAKAPIGSKKNQTGPKTAKAPAGSGADEMTETTAND